MGVFSDYRTVDIKAANSQGHFSGLLEVNNPIIFTKTGVTSLHPNLKETGANTVFIKNGKVTRFQLPQSKNIRNIFIYSINDKDVVTGCYRDPRGKVVGFTWRNGILTILEEPTGMQVEPYKINNNGQIVRYLERKGSQDMNSFLWQNGHMFNLLSLIPADSDWTELRVSSISDKGEILGTGKHGGQPRVFLMSPTLKK